MNEIHVRGTFLLLFSMVIPRKSAPQWGWFVGEVERAPSHQARCHLESYPQEVHHPTAPPAEMQLLPGRSSDLSSMPGNQGSKSRVGRLSASKATSGASGASVDSPLGLLIQSVEQLRLSLPWKRGSLRVASLTGQDQAYVRWAMEAYLEGRRRPLLRCLGLAPHAVPSGRHRARRAA